MNPKGRGADQGPGSPRDGAVDAERPAAVPDHGDAQGIERFRVRTKADVVSVLRGLLQQNALVTAHFGPGADFFVTALLAVDAENGMLVFDHGADARQNERLPRAPAARLETYAEHIRVEFSVGSIATVEFEGKPAFAAPLPPSLLRFQRRETYRVHVPRSRPIVCELPPAGEGGQPVLANVRDISVGGIALVDFPPGFRLVQGTVFERCVLSLTRTDKIAAGLELVHVYRAPHAAPGRGQLVGCRFLHLDGAAEARIQRLINQLDRERLAPG
jgi:c-di-GMP-binding flagellar brake protein YcgR